MSLPLLIPAGSPKDNTHRSSPQSISAEAYLIALSRTWCESLPYQRSVPSYISPSFRASCDFILPGIGYLDMVRLAQANVFSKAGVRETIGQIRATVDCKARRADVYIMRWLQGFEDADEGAVEARRPAVTLLKWERSGEEWMCYEYIGMAGTYGVFADP